MVRLAIFLTKSHQSYLPETTRIVVAQSSGVAECLQHWVGVQDTLLQLSHINARFGGSAAVGGGLTRGGSGVDRSDARQEGHDDLGGLRLAGT